MSDYCITGGKKLSGRVRISGNKNAALPCIAATLLTDDLVQLENVPNIQDVRVMEKLISELGSLCVSAGPESFAFTSNIKFQGLNASLVDSVRGAILFAGPLLARGESVLLPPPGGDVIGLRRLDSHFRGLSALGVQCTVDERGYLSLKGRKRLKGGYIFLDEASVTATENIIMAATLAEGKSTIYNAACEPHIQALCHMLCSMGAHIEGIGSNLLTIEGVERLHGCSFTLPFDYMEAGSFIGLAASTDSHLILEGIEQAQMDPIAIGFQKLGITFQFLSPTVLEIPDGQQRVIGKTYSGVTEKLDDSPWPGFPADLLSIMTVVATQMRGQILIHEKMFESRMYFVDYLIRMGADIILCDPHRAVVNGPTNLRPAEVTSPDVRAGMSLVIAALCTPGLTVIHNIEQIERGYDGLLDKLLNIGADIRLNNTNCSFSTSFPHTC